MSYGHDRQVFEPSDAFRADARISSMVQFNELYERSIADPEGFWGEVASRIAWR